MPDFNVIKIGCIVVILLVLLIAAVIITVKREKSKRKIRRMCDAEKIQLLNELAEPFGFCYVPCEDVFTSREDAWQRKQGYEALYDRAISSLKYCTVSPEDRPHKDQIGRAHV